jgi:hypothetical protein
VTAQSSRAAPAGRSGRDIAAEYVSKLRVECERVWSIGEPLPRLSTGAVNKSELADRCGFPRRVFATNPVALEVLREWDERDAARHVNAFQQAQQVRERTNKSDEYIHRLERRVLVLEAENAQLRRERERFAAIEELMTRTGKLP